MWFFKILSIAAAKQVSGEQPGTTYNQTIALTVVCRKRLVEDFVSERVKVYIPSTVWNKMATLNGTLALPKIKDRTKLGKMCTRVFNFGRTSTSNSTVVRNISIGRMNRAGCWCAFILTIYCFYLRTAMWLRTRNCLLIRRWWNIARIRFPTIYCSTHSNSIVFCGLSRYSEL